VTGGSNGRVKWGALEGGGTVMMTSQDSVVQDEFELNSVSGAYESADAVRTIFPTDSPRSSVSKPWRASASGSVA
jgi:hypothetical protein